MPAKTNQPEPFSSKDDYTDQSYAVTANGRKSSTWGKKLKVTWVFGYCNRTHTVELYDSLTSGKKRLVVDGKTVFQSVLSDLEFSHVVAINDVNVRVTKKHIIIGPDQYVMTIDGTKFSQLRRSSLEVKGSPPPPGAGERVSDSTELAKELQGESSEEEEEEEKDEECEKNESNPFGWSESFEETKQSISSTQSSNNEKELLGLAVCDNQTAPPAPGSGTIPSPNDAFKSLQELAHSLGQQRNYNAGMQQQQQFNQYQMPTSPHAQQMNYNQFQMPTAQQQNFQQQAGSFQQQAGFPSTGDEFAHLHLQSQHNGAHGQFGMTSPTHQQHQPINSIHGIGSPHSQHGIMLQQQGGMMSPTHNNNVQQQQMQNSNNMIAPIGMVQQHANNTWQSNQPVSSMNVQQQQSQQQQQLQQLQQQHQQPQQQVQQQQPQQQLQPQQQSTVKNPFESFDNGSKTMTNNIDAQNSYSLGSMTNAKNNKYIPTANADNFNPFDF